MRMKMTMILRMILVTAVLAEARRLRTVTVNVQTRLWTLGRGWTREIHKFYYTLY